MNKKTIAALIAVPVALCGAVYYWLGSTSATLDRPVFNDFDKKKLNRAYKVMFKKVLTGQYDFDAEDMTTEELDAVLIEEYHKL